MVQARHAARGPRELHVLVVDDNRAAADSLGVLLGLWGYDSRVAYDGNSGLEAACSYLPDCLLLDICMPGMDGYALASCVRRAPGLENARLVALTAYSDEAHRRRAREVGFDHHFVKPVDPTELGRLLDVLDEAMKRASQTPELHAGQ